MSINSSDNECDKVRIAVKSAVKILPKKFEVLVLHFALPFLKIIRFC
jgi:hypothetical protein